MRRRHLAATQPHPARGGRDGPVGGTPPQHQQPGPSRGVVDLDVGDVADDAVDLRLPGAHHQVVIVRNVGDRPRGGVLLQPSDAVLQPRGAGHREGARQVLVAQIRMENGFPLRIGRVRFGGVTGDDRVDVVEIRDPPRLRPVAQVAVGEHDHRGAVLHRDPAGLDGDGETVRGGAGRQHRHRRFTVATHDRLEQVGLLGFGRHARRRPSALHVDDHQGQFGHHTQADGLHLQGHAGTRCGGHPEQARVGGAQRGTDARDLVLRLHRDHADVLAAAQFVEDVGGGGDRVGPQEQLHPGAVGARHQTVSGGEVPGDLAVAAGFHGGRGHVVAVLEDLGGLPVGVPSPEGRQVRVADLGF